MANILLGVTGSVAAIKTPELCGLLRAAGHQVKVVATQAACYFFDPASLSQPPSQQRDPALVVLDEDEWPGRAAHARYVREAPIVHIELRRWAELFLIAPLDANTLAKLANGLSDNCLTCVWRAWDPARPVILAPAMNTMMWEHPLTRRHLCQLALAAGCGHPPDDADLQALVPWMNDHSTRLHIVEPQTKRLACGDIGMGALAELPKIVSAVAAAM